MKQYRMLGGFIMLVLLCGVKTTQLVCAVVRTCPSQRVALPALLLSLASAADAPPRTSLRVFVVDTENHTASLEYIEHAVAAANSLSGTPDFCTSVHWRGFVADRRMFGYDATQITLDALLLLRDDDDDDNDDFACTYFLFTNGDNLYSRYLFSE